MALERGFYLTILHACPGSAHIRGACRGRRGKFQVVLTNIAAWHIKKPIGEVAQLGERCLRKAEAGGSNPLFSTIFQAGMALRPSSRHPPARDCQIPFADSKRQPACLTAAHAAAFLNSDPPIVPRRCEKSPTFTPATMGLVWFQREKSSKNKRPVAFGANRGQMPQDAAYARD